MPAYYKNGELHALSVSYITTGDLFVDGKDVYYPFAKGYLKNGVPVFLPEARDIRSVFVQNGSVYATGMCSPAGAGYWSNGKLLRLPGMVGPLKIVVDNHNNDIYLGGYITDSIPYNTIAYWNKGVWHALREGTFVDIALSSTGVHVVGTSGTDGGLYWINGVEQELAGHLPGIMNSVSVWNDDVYITSQLSRYLYWKNGQPEGPKGTAIGLVAYKGEVYAVQNLVAETNPVRKFKVLINRNGNVDTVGEGVAKGIYLGN